MFKNIPQTVLRIQRLSMRLGTSLTTDKPTGPPQSCTTSVIFDNLVEQLDHISS